MHEIRPTAISAGALVGLHKIMYILCVWIYVYYIRHVHTMLCVMTSNILLNKEVIVLQVIYMKNMKQLLMSVSENWAKILYMYTHM